MKPEAKNQEAYEGNASPPQILSKDGSQGLNNQAGCHAGKEKMLEAAKLAGKSKVLEQFKKDYPLGPHDKPQSMCPCLLYTSPSPRDS